MADSKADKRYTDNAAGAPGTASDRLLKILRTTYPGNDTKSINDILTQQGLDKKVLQ